MRTASGGIRRRVAKLFAAFLLGASCLPSAAGAPDKGSLEWTARSFARSARRAGLAHVVVLPFTSSAGGVADDGWRLSDFLSRRMAVRGSAEGEGRPVVLDILVARRLAQGGAHDPLALRELGRILKADGVVAGALGAAGKDEPFHALLIDLRQGLVLASVGRAPEPEGLEDVVAREELPDLRDSVADDPCSLAALRPDAREGRLLDCKAHEWVTRGHGCGESVDVGRVAGLARVSAWQKREFYQRVCHWHAFKRLWDASKTPRVATSRR